MDELLNAIAALVSLVSPEKVRGIAARVRGVDASKATTTLPSVVGTPLASTVVEQLAAKHQGQTRRTGINAYRCQLRLHQSSF